MPTGIPCPIGTRHIHNGYVRVKVAVGRWDREHRLLWEAANGPIPPGHIIHHINGDKTDNQLENLLLTTPGEHAGQHHRAQLLKMNAAKRGVELSPEQRAQISERLKGNDHMKGKRHTAETKAKMSAAHQRAYAEGRRTRQERCSIDGCERKHKARGFCDMHYQRWKLHQKKSPQDDSIAS